MNEFLFKKKIAHFFTGANSIDRWDFYQDYIRTVMELVKSKDQPETDGENTNIDTSFESCHEFLCEVSLIFPVLLCKEVTFDDMN